MNDHIQFYEEEFGEPQPTGSGFNFWRFLSRRKWIILFGVVAGVGLGYLYLSRQAPVYKSSSQVMVIRRQSKIPIEEIADDKDYSGRIATHIVMLQSPMIIGRAIQENELHKLKSLSQSGDSVETLINGLDISSPGRNADVLELSYTGGDPVDCQKIVDGIAETYKKIVTESQQNVSQETVELITEAKDVLLGQLREKETEYREFRQEAPLLWTGEGGTNVHHSRLLPIESARAEVLLKRTQLTTEREIIESALKRGGSREALMLMVSKSQEGAAAEETENRLTIADKLFPLLLEEQMLLEDHGPDHPKVKAVRKRISLTREFFQNSLIADQDDEPKTKPKDFLTVYLESLDEELRASHKKEEELNDLFHRQREAGKELSVYEVKDQTFRDDIARTQRLFEGVVKRLEEVNLIKDYGNLKAEVLSPAGRGWKVGPNGTQILSIAGILGLIAGMSLAYLIELADKSFRGPEDISHKLHLPVVGHVPIIKVKRQKVLEGSVVDPMICTLHRPKSRTSEIYRGVRTWLYFSVRGSGHKVIQVASPNPGDGKTTLAANLAVSIAQSGKKTLLLDCDCRKPRVHRLFGLRRDRGLSEFLLAEGTLQEGVKQTEVANLWAMTCGRKIANPAELLTSPSFDELLQELRNEYEFVIVDTPPLLAVTDPSVVAARSDGVLLTIRLRKNGSVDAMRANEELAAVGAKVVGVVVNGVGGLGQNVYGQYSYGTRFGYGYGSPYSRYGYGSGYGYGDGDENHYYSDDESDGPPANGQAAAPPGVRR